MIWVPLHVFMCMQSHTIVFKSTEWKQLCEHPRAQPQQYHSTYGTCLCYRAHQLTINCVFYWQTWLCLSHVHSKIQKLKSSCKTIKSRRFVFSWQMIVCSLWLQPGGWMYEIELLELEMKTSKTNELFVKQFYFRIHAKHQHEPPYIYIYIYTHNCLFWSYT